MKILIEKGAQTAKPGEFTLRAFLNGKMDLSQAEAVADLISSENEASHQLAMQQMRGEVRDICDLFFLDDLIATGTLRTERVRLGRRLLRGFIAIVGLIIVGIESGFVVEPDKTKVVF